MCNIYCLRFGEQNLTRAEIAGKRVIEIGSYDVNGSLRTFIESLNPAKYIGVDIEKGYGVDIVCTAEEARERFGDRSFDVVVSTELIEHVLDWRKVISNMKHLCVPGGIVLITTRSKGFDYHGWPYDFWRFEPTDMEQVFSDFAIEKIETDNMGPGVFVKARKPADFRERDLSDYELYSIVDDRRVVNIDEKILADFIRKHADEYRSIERQSLKGRARKIVRDTLWQLKRFAR